MSISSIDTITMAPRTVNAAEAQGKELSQNQNIGTQNAIHFQRETEQQGRQTVATQESETQDYDKQNGKGEGASHQEKRKRKDKKAQPEQKMAPRSDSMFDIMI